MRSPPDFSDSQAHRFTTRDATELTERVKKTTRNYTAPHLSLYHGTLLFSRRRLLLLIRTNAIVVHPRIGSTHQSDILNVTSYHFSARCRNGAHSDSLSKLVKLHAASVPSLSFATPRAVDSNHPVRRIYHRALRNFSAIAFCHALLFFFFFLSLPFFQQSRNVSRSTAVRRRVLSITLCQRTRHEHGDFKHC